VTSKRLGRAFWAESALAAVAALLAMLTLAWPDWIEGVFGVDPDHHDGSAEWAVIGVCCVAAIVCAALARQSWRRARPVVVADA
jgi:hypothetical protein